MKNVKLARSEIAVVLLCTVLMLLVLFVVFGGARYLYTNVIPNHASRRSPSPAEISDAYHALISYREDPARYIVPSPFSGSDDLLEKASLYQIYTEKTDSSYSHMQGACTDGKYLWIGWSVPKMIMKIRLLTNEIETFRYTDETWAFGHINDMTYNPNTNELLVCAYWQDEPETAGNLAILDADTLDLKRVVSVHKNQKPLAFHGIAYDRLHDRYILATSGTTYDLIDSSFHYLDTIKVTRHENDTLQGIETDGTYLYRSLWGDFEKNRISVYDLDGNFIRLVNVPLSGYETELQDILYDWNGNWYINTADYDRTEELAGASIYYLGLQNSVDYEKVMQFQSALKMILTGDGWSLA